MTPQQFNDSFRATATQVSDGTGIDPVALLAQWAAETAWGTQLFGNNLGNIRCSPTTFCQYATLSDFANACIAVFHSGLYNAVLAATNAIDQLAAIVASPWAANHYGGSLSAFYTPLEGFDLTPGEHQDLELALAFVNGAHINGPSLDEQLTVGFNGALDKILAAVKAIPPPPAPTVDFTPVLNAIATLSTAVAAVKADVDAIKAKTDRDLA